MVYKSEVFQKRIFKECSWFPELTFHFSQRNKVIKSDWYVYLKYHMLTVKLLQCI